MAKDSDSVRNEVRRVYARAAKPEDACCAPSTSSASTSACCDGNTPGGTAAERLGYHASDVAAVPDGADLGLGCGNPQAIASLRPGEIVLDLGSGAGFDSFLAARAIGAAGRVIGVDMTPEMLAKARDNAAKAGITNVEFRLGEIEALPVANDSVDVIISNCVINLSPDKPRVFREAWRVLKPAGRLAIADTVRTAPMPPEILSDLAAHCGCVAGAASVDELQAMLADAGFSDLRIQARDSSREFIREWLPGRNAADYVVSATIEAVKPGTPPCGCC